MEKDYSASAEFLRNFFGPTTEHNVELRSLPQEHGGGPNRPRFTRDTEIAQEHLVKWDLPGRACYFGACTRVTGKASGSRADCAEMPALWVDIDCEKQSFSKNDAVAAALSLPLRPSLLVDSGGGVHGYWLLNEAMPVPLGPLCDDEAIIAVLKQLAGVLAGDPAVCDIARVMRLPGTFNHKYGSPRLCSLLPISDFGLRYEFSDISEMLSIQQPVLVPSSGIVPNIIGDPFLELGKLIIRGQMDVEARLAAMTFKGDGESSIHLTTRDVAASLAARGKSSDEIVSAILPRVQTVTAHLGKNWNWEPRIRELALSGIAKYAPKETAIAVNAAPGRSNRWQPTVVQGGGAVAIKTEEQPVEADDEPDVKARKDEIVRVFNSRYSVVNEDGRAMVYEAARDERMNRSLYRRITFEDLKKFFLNTPVQIGWTDPARGKPKPIIRTMAEIWLTHTERKQYLGGVTFDPSGSCAASVLNLWRGFAVEAASGSWALLKEHIYEVLCRGNADCYDFLVGWMARLVQYPSRQGEVAVVLRSTAHGAGKGTLARALMRVLGQHSMAITNSKQLTGAFNGHLRDCVFLFADEAFWAGDKQGISVLKSLITEPYLTIEAKYQTPVQTPNFLHTMMAANAEWVVPAALTDRRFFVLDVPDTRARDKAYFSAIEAELENGGHAAMLHELLAYDLSNYDFRTIPQTEGLDDQRTLSLEPIEEWWQTVLAQGYAYRSKLGLEGVFSEWKDITSTELLYASYMEFASKRRSYRPTVLIHFGRFLKRMGGTRKRQKLTVGEHIVTVESAMGHKSREPKVFDKDNVWGYEFGSLANARQAFEKATGIKVDWDN